MTLNKVRLGPQGSTWGHGLGDPEEFTSEYLFFAILPCQNFGYSFCLVLLSAIGARHFMVFKVK